LPPISDASQTLREFRDVPNCDICGAAKFSLFDRLVGVRHEQRRYIDAHCFGRFEVDHQLEFGWLLDGNIGSLGAAEDFDSRASSHGGG